MIDILLGGESEQIIIPINGTNLEQQKSIVTPKIWMNFDDFCACFTSVDHKILFSNSFIRIFQFNYRFSQSSWVSIHP
jgi:hypothetical protein